MASGVIKRIVQEKGFGFISSNDADADFFFHRSAVRQGQFETLAPGTRVEFEIGEGAKGPRAERVSVVTQ